MLNRLGTQYRDVVQNAAFKAMMRYISLRKVLNTSFLGRIDNSLFSCWSLSPSVRQEKTPSEATLYSIQRERNPFSIIRPLESSINMCTFMPRLSALDTTSQRRGPMIHQRRKRMARIGSNHSQPSTSATSRANSITLSCVMLAQRVPKNDYGVSAAVSCETQT